MRNSHRWVCRLAFCVLASVFSLAQAQTTAGARILEQSGQLDAAMAEYRAVLAHQPADLVAYAGLRRLAGPLDRFDLLDSVSARLSGLYPERPDYALGRVEALVGLEQVRQAVEAARRLLARWPGQIMAVADLFERGGALGPATEFLAEYRKAAGEQRAAARLAELYERQQRYPEAARELVSLAVADPRAAAAMMPRLREYGAHPGWRAVLNEVRRLPTGPTRARAEAEVLLGAGRKPDAVRAAMDGMSRDELYGFAHEAEQTGALGAALALYEELRLPAEQARVLRELGRVDDALRLLREDPSPRAQLELAQLERLVRGDFAAAARTYSEILRRDPRNAEAAWGLAASRIALADTAGAREALAAIAQPSDSVQYFKVRLAFYTGSTDSLRRLANRMLTRFPTSRYLSDVLELVSLSSLDDEGRPLARAMLAHEAGRTDSALAVARELAEGSGAGAENAMLLAARILAETGQVRAAFGVLDSFPDRFPTSPRRARALFEQAELAGALQDDNLRLRLLEQLVLEYPESPYAIVGRTVRAELVQPREPPVVR